MFSKEFRYSDIDWGDLNEIVRAYRTRLLDWYLDPAAELAKNPHFAFSVMALNCLLIETLGQLVFDRSGRYAFKSFVREHLPVVYSAPLGKRIKHCEPGKKPKMLKDVADVLYHAFRCGILHQAHLPPYAGVDPELGTPVEVRALGLVKYQATGDDCPSVVLNPRILLVDLRRAFEEYFAALVDPVTEEKYRENFKSRFSSSFGIDIHEATLGSPDATS